MALLLILTTPSPALQSIVPQHQVQVTDRTVLCPSGMRLGELKALKWEDINFNKRSIEVKRSCRRGRITDTKNHKRRRADMTPLLAKTLKRLETTQKKAALKRGQPVPEWVFANKRGEI